MKNMSGNVDSTNNSLVHPEESLDNETLQVTARSGHNDIGQEVKAQTGLTCVVSQTESILRNRLTMKPYKLQLVQAITT